MITILRELSNEYKSKGEVKISNIIDSTEEDLIFGKGLNIVEKLRYRHVLNLIIRNYKEVTIATSEVKELYFLESDFREIERLYLS